MKSPRFITWLCIAAATLVVSCNPVKTTTSARRALTQFHTQLDQGDFAAIYNAAHAEFKTATTAEKFTSLLDAVHRKLGNVQESTQTGINLNSFNFKTNVVLTQDTKFAGGNAVETFTYRMDGEKAVLLGYYINSQELITK